MPKNLNVDEQYEEFSKELELAHDGEQTSTEMMMASIMVVQDYLRKFKDDIGKKLITDEEEIHFFKNVKPRFYQWSIYHVELHSIISSRPLPHGKNLYRYFVEQLSFLNRFFRQNEFYYQYYKLGAKEMDQLYFKRGAEIPRTLIAEIPEIDPAFGTGMDYLFAKFMAYENLQEYLIAEIRKLSAKPKITTPPSESGLTWTGDKTNLVEVIYGLFYTGQLNNGNAKVADIIKWMEQQLNIDLSRSYKNFVDIRNRKRDSPTRFLDKMREFILQRIDEDNRYKPNRGAKLLDRKE